MARVTVEDCLEKVEDRFELVALAAQRAKAIASGAAPTIEPNGEKFTVVALREIAGGSVAVDDLREDLTRTLQTQRHMDEDVQDDDHDGETELGAGAVAELESLENEGAVEEFEEEVEREAADEAAEEASEDDFSFEDENLDVID